MTRVIVVGGQDLAVQVAEAIKAAGDEVTVVLPPGEPEPAVTEPPLRFVAGDPLTPAALEAAGARRCDVLVACTRSDEDNLVISLLAKRMFEVARVVARVNERENSWLFDQSWGVDAAVSPSAAVVGIVKPSALGG